MSLQRNTPLKAKSELKRKTPMQRTAKKPAKKQSKPKKPTATDYKRWCDQLFSLIVRSRGSCAKCGTDQRLQCSHIVSRSYLATRWDERNADCLCLNCHAWWHHKPLEAEAWTIGRGIDLPGIKTKAMSHERPTYPDLFAALVIRAEQLDIDTAKFRKHLPSE